MKRAYSVRWIGSLDAKPSLSLAKEEGASSQTIKDDYDGLAEF